MRQVIDALWAAIKNSAANRKTKVTVVNNTTGTLVSDSINLVLPNQDPTTEIYLYLPSVTEDTVVRFYIDFSFPRMSDSKDISTSIRITNRNEKGIVTSGGTDGVAGLSMAGYYDAYFIASEGKWRINDAVAVITGITGYQLAWTMWVGALSDVGVAPLYDNDRLVLIDQLTPQVDPEKRRFVLSVDVSNYRQYVNDSVTQINSYSTEDANVTGDDHYRTGRQLTDQGYNWEITNVIPFFWPWGVACVDYVAEECRYDAAGNYTGTAWGSWRSSSYSGGGFAEPNSFGTPSGINKFLSKYYTTVVGGAFTYSAVLVEKQQPANQPLQFWFRNCCQKQSTETYVFDSSNWGFFKKIPLDITLDVDAEVLNFAQDRISGRHAAMLCKLDGAPTDEYVVITAYLVDSGEIVAGSAGRSTVTLPTLENDNQYWKIVGYDSRFRSVWIERRNKDGATPKSQQKLYRINYNANSYDEVVMSPGGGMLTFDYELYYDHNSKKSFWLMRCLEPFTGKVMLGIQSGEYDQTIPSTTPMVLYEVDNTDFDLASYQYLPREDTTIGYLAIKTKQGYWNVAEVDLAALANL